MTRLSTHLLLPRRLSLINMTRLFFNIALALSRCYLALRNVARSRLLLTIAHPLNSLLNVASLTSPLSHNMPSPL